MSLSYSLLDIEKWIRFLSISGYTKRRTFHNRSCFILIIFYAPWNHKRLWFIFPNCLSKVLHLSQVWWSLCWWRNYNDVDNKFFCWIMIDIRLLLPKNFFIWHSKRFMAYLVLTKLLNALRWWVDNITIFCKIFWNFR